MIDTGSLVEEVWRCFEHCRGYLIAFLVSSLAALSSYGRAVDSGKITAGWGKLARMMITGGFAGLLAFLVVDPIASIPGQWKYVVAGSFAHAGGDGIDFIWERAKIALSAFFKRFGPREK